MDNDSVLDFQSSKRVTYLDVASRRDCFIVYMRILKWWGCTFEKTFAIFQNSNGNYSISGIPDNIDGMTYRSYPKGRMTSRMFVNYFSDPNNIQPPDNNKTQTVWIDSFRAHKESPKLL